jgi:type II restriction/modification system DNA methylase subunit YeeA
LIDDKAVAGYKAFNWKEEFKEVFDKGGFDVVIGNPPYVRVEFVTKRDVEFFKKNYMSASGKFDLSSLFIEKALTILNKKGKVSIISSYQFIYTSSGIGVRNFISKNSRADFLIFSSGNQIFESATTYTGILNFVLRESDFITIKKAKAENNEISILEIMDIGNSDFNKEKVIVSNAPLINKLKGSDRTYFGKQIGTAKTGVVTSADDVFSFHMNL